MNSLEMLGQYMNEVTLLVIVNDKKKYNEFLSCLNKQRGIEFRCVPIFNVNNEKFVSARTAYNSELENINSKYVAFCHPDVFFLDEYALRDIFVRIDEIKDFGIVGIAGCPSGKNRFLYSTMYHGVKREPAGISFSNQREVQTVDECFFVMKTDSSFRFSGIEGWHLYAVEECLNKLLDDKVNYVVEANVWHVSNGQSLDSSYMTCLEKIIKKYKAHFPLINTTVKQWETQGLIAWGYRKYYFMKQYVKKRMINIL